jgi:hypothetical protein
MLVIISDLHLTDRTTSRIKGGDKDFSDKTDCKYDKKNKEEKDLSNVSSKAFKAFFGQIAGIIQRREEKSEKEGKNIQGEKKQNKIKNLTFVYNGDIFDPLRSARWFDDDKRSSPWRKPYSSVDELKKFHSIMECIMEEHEESLKWLSCTHDDFPDIIKEKKPKLVYIPGNHDRTVNLYQPTRALVYDRLLGEPGNEGEVPFKNSYPSPGHETIVMHGNQADAFNCEFKKNGEPDYGSQPIGDAMTTMLFSSIGHEAQELGISKEVKDRLRDIEHVRPHLKGISYVQDIIRDIPKSASKISEMIDEIVNKFRGLDYYGDWIKKHNLGPIDWDRLRLRVDEADKLRAALWLVDTMGLKIPAGKLEGISKLIKGTSYADFAKGVLSKGKGKDMRYCVLGHTHEPLHVPLYQEKGVERHYLNTGTFRINLGETLEGNDFLRFRRMSFVIIYGPGELDDGTGYPMYELWSGLRMA